MAICNCRNARCNCIFIGGFGVEVTGNGSARNPYVPEALAWAMEGLPGSSADVNVTGDGTPGSPWVISVDVHGSAVTRTVFETSDIWIKTPGSLLHVVAVGGGGGGDSGYGVSQETGGWGGGGGAMSTAWMVNGAMPEEISVIVGAGGTAGHGIGAPGQWGGHGGTSQFGPLLFASGGRGGDFFNAGAGGVVGTYPEGGPGGRGAYYTDTSGPVGAEALLETMGAGGGGRGEGLDYPATLGAEPLNVFYPPRSGGNGGTNGVIPPDMPLGFGGGGGGGCSKPLGFSPGSPGAPGVVIVTTW